ncbi:hypothetical protein KC318_g9414 [Hortaea werneckii]|nr:hypothetical protein KC334_g9643 [Hortaea werneckii]KAI7003072.1 hypothetical protein KC355_g9417 [Hortaea werneckii]KAI7661510.1 hypothetical protein KC318_g9414 [Hortaea werneckii]
MDYYTNALPGPPTRTLRSMLPIVWPIGFALLLAHGATQAVLLPVLGIIPMTFSSLTGLIHLRGILDDFRLTTLFLDFFCAAILFALLMPSWLVIARDYGYYYGAGTIMLATYGTVPLMVQLKWEARFGEYQDLPTGGDDMTSIPGSGKQPQQQQETGKVFLEDKEQHSKDDQRQRSSTSSYSSAGEGMPRPSTDDETARLV